MLHQPPEKNNQKTEAKPGPKPFAQPDLHMSAARKPSWQEPPAKGLGQGTLSAMTGVFGGLLGGSKAGLSQLAQAVGHFAEPAKNTGRAAELPMAKGESLAEKARHTAGPVKMSAAQAMKVTHELAAEKTGAEKAAAKKPGGPKGSGMGFYQDFASVALSGITNNQDDAAGLDAAVTGEDIKHAEGYAAYGSNPIDYGNGFQSEGTKTPDGPLGGALDALNDVAAVTQYAAAADKAVKLNKGPDGKPQVQIDWAALGKMEVSADLGALGGQIKYDSPRQVADNGYATVLKDMKDKGLDPANKDQFVSLTGHSGGGQSSFYTALKLASEGYKNVSLVGVDMAITPHEREVLEAMGVKVTNITSHNVGSDGKRTDSEVGQGIQAGMGGGQNYYDLNVQRQQEASMTGRHSLANDPNVLTQVRFSQYLDSIGQHGNYSPTLFGDFMKATNQQGNKLNGVAADHNVLSTTIDQRGLPGPEANSTDPQKANNSIEKIINTLPVLGDKVNGWFDGIGNGIENKLDKVGDKAQSGISGFFGKLGSFFGGGANKVLDTVGRGIDNGLDKAGDVAESWLGHIPLVGGFLGKAANTGLDWLGDKIGGGFDRAGDKAQSGIEKGFNSVGNTIGGGVNTLIDGVGRGIGNVFDRIGDFAGAKVQGGIDKVVGGLQGVGIDLSQIKSLSGYGANNPSATRGWENLLTPPSEQSDPTKFQTVAVQGGEPAKVQNTYVEDFKNGIDAKLAGVKDLKPEQQQAVKDRLHNVSADTLAPVEMVAVDRALAGPNADRALSAYSDLIKMSEADPKAQERLNPEILAMLVTGVGDRRTESDRGQAGILGQRSARDAAQGLLNMSEEDFGQVQQLLSQAGKDKDGKPIPGADPAAEQALILKAIAARRDNVKEPTGAEKALEALGVPSKHSVAMQDLDTFAADIRGTKRDDLIRTTTLMDIDNVNTSNIDPTNIAQGNDQNSDNDGLYQRFDDSCTVAIAQVARAEADPVYARKVHKEGVSDPNPNNDAGTEQSTLLEKHGGVAVSRLGSQARSSLDQRIVAAQGDGSLSMAQTTALQRLVDKAPLLPGQEQQAQAALAVLRANNDGHPTDAEVEAMKANANKNSRGLTSGRLPLEDLAEDVTHLDYKDHDVQSGGGIGSHLAGIDDLLRDGQTVPFRADWTDGGAHAMMISDVRTGPDGTRSYLMTDPWTGATRFVPEADLKNGSFSANHFGGNPGDAVKVRVDQSQNP